MTPEQSIEHLRLHLATLYNGGLALRLLESFGSTGEILQATTERLLEVRGMSPAIARRLHCDTPRARACEELKHRLEGPADTGCAGERHEQTVAVDGEGYLDVADWGNERVQVLDPKGSFVMKTRGEATISNWAANFLSVNAEAGAARTRADLEPDIEYFVDVPHEESAHIEKFFWSPVSVKLDRAGMLFVTESNRHRIQVYKRSAS